MILLALVVLTGCSSKHVVNDNVYRQRTETMYQRIDSLLASRSVIKQDSTFRESVLRELQRIRERSDTSRYVQTDSAGNIIREKIIINNVREVTNATDRQEREVLIHRLEQMDSVVNVQQQQLSRIDSMLQQKTKTVEVPAALSWWQELRMWLGSLLLIGAGIYAVVVLLRRRI